MSANTAFLNLYKPGGGSSGLIVPDEVVDVDRINSNMDLIDAFASSWGLASRQTRDFTGPAASMAAIAVSPRIGDTYQETDSNKILWRYDGANWGTNESGMILIRPTSIVGAAVSASGLIVPSSGAKLVSCNNVFTSRFRNYRIVFSYDTGDVNGAWMKFRSAGADTTAADYRNILLYSNGGATPAAAANGGVTSHPLPPVGGTAHYGIIDILSPEVAVSTQIDDVVNTAVTGTMVTCHGAGFMIGTSAASSFDGFTISLSSTAQNAFDITKSWFKLYGMA